MLSYIKLVPVQRRCRDPGPGFPELRPRWMTRSSFPRAASHAMQAIWAGGIQPPALFLLIAGFGQDTTRQERRASLGDRRERVLTMRMIRLLTLVVLAVAVLLIAVQFGPAVFSGK
jgi:hypothetical protein